MRALPSTDKTKRLRRWLGGYGLFAGLCLLWLLSTFGAFWFDGLLAWTAGLFYVGYDTWLIAYVAWQTRALRPALPAKQNSVGPLPSLGIVVPARNEALVLAATLDPLLAQLAASDRLLLVDDGSIDGTRALLAERYGIAGTGMGCLASPATPQFAVLFRPGSGKADSLNAGWRALEGMDVIVTVDADTRVAHGALQAFREAFAEDPKLVAACGILRPVGRGGWQARLFETFQRFEYLRAFLSRAAWMRQEALLLVSGAFAAYRRDMLVTIEGFATDCLVEDYELIHRLHEVSSVQGLGWRVKVLPGPRAVTDAPADTLGFLRQRRRWFAGFLQTQFAYRHLHGDARYGAVGRLMLPVKAVDTLQPLFGLTAFVLLAVFLLSGAAVAPLVLTVIVIKLAIDFSYHFWALGHYHRWLGQGVPSPLWGRAALATLVEPFSFQLLRHAGAAWGWWQIISGARDWAPQQRQRLEEPEAMPATASNSSPTTTTRQGAL